MERRSEESLTFIGTSQVLGTKGEVLYRASSDREESIVIEIDPGNARDKHVTAVNHIFDDRRVTFL